MLSKDIQRILSKEPKTVFLATPIRTARWGRPALIVKFRQEPNKLPIIHVRWIQHDGLSRVCRVEARNVKQATEQVYGQENN